MTASDLVADITARATAYVDCSREQALVYACEDLCEHGMPSRPLTGDLLDDVVDRISHTEDIDPPRVVVSRRLRRTAGAADTENRIIHLAGPVVPLLTVVHELAHFTAAVEGHGADFLHEMVHLVRVHVGVQHAAFLHGLYLAAGLPVPPWHATERR